MRALDARAMELASSDRELSAALFRFVDVVPGVPVARRPRASPARVPRGGARTPPLPIAAAMRIADTRAGARRARRGRRQRRQAHGAPVHRRRDARSRARRAARPVGARRRQLGRPARRGDGHAGRGRPLRRALQRGARAARARSPQLARAADARARQHRAAAARQRLGQGLGADAAAATRRSRARRAATPPQRLRPLLRARTRARRPHPHRHGVARLARGGARAGARAAVRGASSAPGPSAGHRAPGVPARLPGAARAILDWAAASQRTPPLQVRLVKGAYWDHELVAGAPARLAGPGVRGQGRLRPQLRGAHRHAAATRGPMVRVAIASHNLRSVAHAIAYNRLLGGDDRDLELQVLRGLGDELQDALASQRLPGAHVLPGRRPRRGDGLPRPAAAREHEQRVVPVRAGAGRRRSRSCWRRRERRGRRPRSTPFANEPILELRRAAVRAGARRTRCARSTRRLPLRSVAGDDRRRGAVRGASCVSTDPGEPDRVVAHAARATAAEVRRGGRRRRAAGRRTGRLARAEERARALLRRRRMDARAPARARGARGPRVRQAVARGRRRRVRGDRLPRVLRARRDRARGGPGAAPGPGRAQRAALRPARRRGRHLAVELPDRDPVRDDRRGARDRQHGRAQAGRAVARVRAAHRSGAARRRRAADGDLAAPGRGRRRRRAGPPSATCRRSRSRARSRSASRSSAPRPRWCPASATSSGSSPSSAARTA